MNSDLKLMAVNNNMASNKIAGFHALIPNFDGESYADVEYFVKTLEDIASIADWSDEEKLVVLKSKIRGSALQIVISSLELRLVENYSQFKDKFIEFFQTRTNLNQSQKLFEGCKQKTDESIKFYANRISNATIQYLKTEDKSPAVKSLIDQTKLIKFLDGLLPNIRKAVMSHGPKTFDEAVNMAELEALHLNMYETEQVNHVNAESDAKDRTNQIVLECLNRQMEATEKLYNLMEEKINKLSINQRQPQEDRLNRGPTYQNNSYRPQMFCQICHRNNHNTDMCYYNRGVANYPPFRFQYPTPRPYADFSPNPPVRPPLHQNRFRHPRPLNSNQYEGNFPRGGRPAPMRRSHPLN